MLLKIRLKASQWIYGTKFFQLCLSSLEYHIWIYNYQQAFSVEESDTCNRRKQNCESGDVHISGSTFFKTSDACFQHNFIAPNIFNKVTWTQPFPPLFLKYLPLLKVDTSLFQMITSSHPRGSRYFIPLVLDGQFQNNSCWMWYRAAPSLTPKENLGMSWSSWLTMSTLRRAFCLQWPLWLTLPAMTVSSEMDQNKIGKWWN